jgi:hypothetical protein
LTFLFLFLCLLWRHFLHFQRLSLLLKTSLANRTFLLVYHYSILMRSFLPSALVLLIKIIFTWNFKITYSLCLFMQFYLKKKNPEGGFIGNLGVGISTCFVPTTMSNKRVYDQWTLSSLCYRL